MLMTCAPSPSSAPMRTTSASSAKSRSVSVVSGERPSRGSGAVRVLAARSASWRPASSRVA